MGSAPPPRSRVTVPDIVARKGDGPPLVMVTAYDATFARLADRAEVDIVLVGDSVGMVVQGHEDTLAVTLEDMIYHAKCVRRGLTHAHLVVDMPFMSYQIGPQQALASAGRLVKEGGAAAVKLEGGARVAESVRRIVEAGIPVMGHLGLTPQSVHAFGGFRVQGRSPEAALRLRRDAQALVEAGCYSIVLESIPAPLAAELSASLQVPTIGIGAGAGCDGQVLVMQDLLGLNPDFKPRFVKRYAQQGPEVIAALKAYAREVQSRDFPANEHSFGLPAGDDDASSS